MRLFLNSINSSQAQEAKTWLICLQAGQSNARSAADANVSTVPLEYQGAQSNVLKTCFNIPNFDWLQMEFNNTSDSRWNSGIPENPPLASNKAGVEIKLWKDIADATGKNILLVHLAYGGEGFTQGPSAGNGAWNLTRGVDNTGIAWEHLDAAWLSLQNYIAANNLTTENGFIYWNQGESDVGNANYFTTDLPTAFTRFRGKFGEDVHIYSAGINPARGAIQVTFEANQAAYNDPANAYTFMSNTDKTWQDAGDAQTGIHLDFVSQFMLADQIKALYLP